MKIDEEGEDCSLTNEEIEDFETFVIAYKIMTQRDENN
jgi:hypothetical protein